jgi:hypothetical protein
MAINSFRRLFYGRFEPVPTGTLIQGEFRVHVLVRTFMAVGLGFAGFSLLIQILAAVASSGPINWFSISVPAVMVFAGITMYSLGQKVGEPEENDVLSYICDRLQASKAAA